MEHRFVAGETERMHKRLGGACGVIKGICVCGKGVDMERPGCKCNLLHRSEDSLCKKKDGFV